MNLSLRFHESGGGGRFLDFWLGDTKGGTIFKGEGTNIGGNYVKENELPYYAKFERYIPNTNKLYVNLVNANLLQKRACRSFISLN